MFKAVKMKRLKFLLLSFVLGCAMLAGAQTPEVFPLWPQGVKENNGIKVDRTVDDQGGISNNSTAELLVFHPDPAKNTGKAVLICPGGGYTYLAMGYEGEEFAQWLVKQGITGIVLKYRMPNQHDRIPMTDALRAMKWVRSRSEEWGIDPAKVGIAGFSAGGHLASTVSTHFDSGKSGTTVLVKLCWVRILLPKLLHNTRTNNMLLPRPHLHFYFIAMTIQWYLR